MRTLLLADDNVTVQRVIMLTFAREPVRIVTVSDGQQAMDCVVVERPDIVLAGTALPHVNGYELARFVRNNAALKHVPVLLLSGAFETVDEAELKSSGATGLIEKPIEPTAVVSRVKELLGIKTEEQPPPPDRRAAAPLPRMVTSTRPMPPGAVQTRATNDDAYLDSLESALDSLDQQLAGTAPSPTQRNGVADPAAPVTRPVAESRDAGNPVYEVDDDWFSESAARDAEPAGAWPDLADDLHAPELKRAAPVSETPSPPVYEVDDEWFVEDTNAREARELEQRQLAAEMGIHEIEVPEVPEVPGVTEVPGVPEVPRVPGVPRVPRVPEVPESDVLGVAEIDSEPPAAQAGSRTGGTFEPLQDEARDAARVRDSFEPAAIEVPKLTRIGTTTFGGDVASAGPPGRVADDFAALLAFERGEKKAPPIIEPVIHTVTPEITPEMLERIASTVADRLRDSVRVEARAPELTDGILNRISSAIAERLHVEAKAPEIGEAMLERLADSVAARLKDSIRVEPASPELTGDMLDRIAHRVSERMQGAMSMDAMRDGITAAVRDTVRTVVSETSERLVREEIERIKSKNQ